jgi:nitrate/TMAO reductase-like tetraheme cytochrome c subunit
MTFIAKGDTYTEWNKAREAADIKRNYGESEKNDCAKRHNGMCHKHKEGNSESPTAVA